LTFFPRYYIYTHIPYRIADKKTGQAGKCSVDIVEQEERCYMKNIINGIIAQIPSGVVFDTHTIIEYLLQNNSDDYLSHYAGGSTEAYHGMIIGHIIASFEGTLINRVGKSWSMNIRKNFSECTCWRKIG
jgi:hypothetical protein